MRQSKSLEKNRGVQKKRDKKMKEDYERNKEKLEKERSKEKILKLFPVIQRKKEKMEKSEQKDMKERMKQEH